MRKLLNLIDRFRCFYWFSLLSYSLFCLLSVFLFFSASNSLCAQLHDVVVIFFDSDDNSITQESIGVIKRNANALKATPEFTITLEGYSDITGRADYNLELSEKRALLVKDYLVELDIDSNKIKVIGKGGTEKYGKGESNDALQQNRRVNLIIDIPSEPKIEVQTQEREELPQTILRPSEKPEEEGSTTDPISQTKPYLELDNKMPNVSPTSNLSKLIEKKVRTHAPDGIVFTTPSEMKMGESYLIEAEVSYSYVNALSEGLNDIKLDNKIGMKLTGNGFDIAPDIENDQDEDPKSDNNTFVKEINKDAPLKWKWLVTPARDGIRSLILSLSITVENSESGPIIGEYATFQRLIEVRPNMIHSITNSYWVMGILIVLIIAVVAWILIRRVRVH